MPTLFELSIIFFFMGFFAMAHIVAFTDINIILSNILDNAIEGALKSKEKIIYIDIFEKNNNIVLALF